MNFHLVTVALILTGILQVHAGYGATNTEPEPEQLPAVEQIQSVAKPRHSSPLNYEVCDEICDVFGDCTIYYCPGDGICCTPGSPTSLCCPATKPLCMSGGRCCAKEYPKLCGDMCCKSDGVCCKEENMCCASDKTCCGSNCCSKTATCCTDSYDQPQTKTCCDEATMACCGEAGCFPPCESQFDVIPCVSLPIAHNGNMNEETTLARLTVGCLDYIATGYLYRLINVMESCQAGLVARDPFNSEQRTILSHVNCGSRKFKKGPKIGQYIINTPWMSTSSTFEALLPFYTDNAVRIRYPQDFGAGCFVEADLTKEAVRKFYLGNAILANRFASSSCEVLVRCPPGSKISCTNYKPNSS